MIIHEYHPWIVKIFFWFLVGFCNSTSFFSAWRRQPFTMMPNTRMFANNLFSSNFDYSWLFEYSLICKLSWMIIFFFDFFYLQWIIFNRWFYFECRGNSNWSLTSCLYRYSWKTKNEQTFVSFFPLILSQFWHLCVVFKYFTSFYVPWRWQPVSRMPTFFPCMMTNIWITYMYPGNLLLVAGGQSLRLTATFAVKMSKTTQNQRRNLPNDKCLFFGFWRHLLFFQV